MNSRHLSLMLGFILSLLCWIAPNCLAQESGVNQKIAVINIPAEEAVSQSNQSSPTTVTVGPLIARQGDQAWLSKAIADLLIKNLSEARSLIVLERQKMQAFANEVGLGDSALFNQERALRVGRVAKVQKVIYGNYSLKRNTITISIFLMDLKTQNILLKDNITGDYDQLRSLVKELVFRFLAHQNVALSESEKKNIQFQATDSMTATEHFYRGIDAYDQGKYAEAFGEFLWASRQDTKYFEARLFVGRMLAAQGFYEHAVLSYEQFYEKYPQTVEARDALLFAGKILEVHLGDPKKARGIYEKLSLLKPINVYSLQGSYALGNLFYEQGEHLRAYQEFKKIDDYRIYIKNNPLAVERRQGRRSRFFTWQRALNLYKESIVKMAALYQKLIEDLPADQLPKPPRGLIVLDPDNPSFKEVRFGHTKSLFLQEQKYPNWNEKLYIVIAPKGYVATGVDFSVTGQMKQSSSSYDYTMRILPFPLPRNFDQHWYGVIFGQTKRKETLNKFVSFHGKKLEIFTIQLLERNSTIFDWGLNVRLLAKEDIKDEENASYSDEKDVFWEGKPIARIPFEAKDRFGSTRLSQETWYEPKKDMDLLHDPLSGSYLVVAQGHSDGQPTDLWMTHSKDINEWPSLERLSINSSSEDFNPRLIRGEDGVIRLAWISNRRGQGWELWMSHQKEDKRWAHPQRIPLEKFAETGMEKRVNKLSLELLEYDIFQDNRGRWIIMYYSYEEKALIFIQSKDTREWTLLSKVPVEYAGFGFSLVQDSSARYRLGMIGGDWQLYLFSSNDAVKWKKRRMKFSFRDRAFFSTPMLHRLRFIPLESGRLLMLISDGSFGLQFARFSADTEEPILDLVSRVGLEGYAATQWDHGNYLVAIKEDEQVVLRHYKKFNISGKAIDKDTRGWPIYKETEADQNGNSWTRIFAQMRRIVPDVTALGLQPNGRLWWGIETGIMYKDNEHFYATDVSLGFFYHFITQITGCSDEKVWFSSKYLRKSELGFVNLPRRLPGKVLQHRPRHRFQRVFVPNVKGAITDIICGPDNGDIYLGTEEGAVLEFNGKDAMIDFNLDNGTSITSLAYDKQRDELWIGTKAQGLYLVKEKKVKKHFDQTNGLPTNQVIDLVVDQQGALWAAVYSEGLMRYKDGEWKHFTKDNAGLLYWSMDHLVADPNQGVWYLPHADVPSKGLGYFNGVSAQSFNPPHQILPNPSSLVVKPNGVVWAGTWFDGLYRLERKSSATTP